MVPACEAKPPAKLAAQAARCASRSRNEPQATHHSEWKKQLDLSFRHLTPAIPTTPPVIPTASPVIPTASPVIPTTPPVIPTTPPVIPTEANHPRHSDRSEPPLVIPTGANHPSSFRPERSGAEESPASASSTTPKSATDPPCRTASADVQAAPLAPSATIR